MQSDEKFGEAVSRLITTLRRLQGLDSQWVEKVGDQTQLDCTDEMVPHPLVEFPGGQDVMTQFSVDKLRTTLEDLVADGSRTNRVSAGEINAASRQLQFLLDFQRYYARRKVSRARRIINAAHRRVILTHPQGPLAQRLRAAVDDLLAQAR